MMNNNSIIYVCECGCEVELEKDNMDTMETLMHEHKLCEDCFMEQFEVCEICGSWHKIDEMDSVWYVNEDEEIMVCLPCWRKAEIENRIFFCDYHERYEYTGRYSDYTVIQNYGWICQDAFDWADCFSYCEECDNYFHENEMCWDDDTEMYYCEECYETVCGNRVIRGYHNHKDDYEYNKLMSKKEREEGLKNYMFYGMEIEIENTMAWGTEREDLAREIQEVVPNEFEFENDGSLDDGFEMITYPFTKDYMFEKLESKIARVLEIVEENKYSATESCGLHFHMTKLNDEQMNNLICAIEYYKEEITELSKRTERKLSRWASFYTEDLNLVNITKEKILDTVSKNRYRAVNITNRKTVEFRFFNGTTDFEELMARFEIVSNINEWAINNELEEDLSNMPTFYELLTYDTDKYVSEYLLNNFPQFVLPKATNKAKATN